MRSITGAVVRAARVGRGLLPTGQLLTPEVWAQRHRGIVWLLWLHVAGIAAFAVVRGYGLLHGLQEAMLGRCSPSRRRTRRSGGGPARPRPRSG